MCNIMLAYSQIQKKTWHDLIFPTCRASNEVHPFLKQIEITHKNVRNLMMTNDIDKIADDRPIAMKPDHFLVTIYHQMVNWLTYKSAQCYAAKFLFLMIPKQPTNFTHHTYNFHNVIAIQDIDISGN